MIGVIAGIAYYTWARLYERARQQEETEGKVASAEGRANATAETAANRLTLPERVVKRVSARLRPPVLSSEPTLLFDIEEYMRASHRESVLRALEGFDDIELGRVATPSQLV